MREDAGSVTGVSGIDCAGVGSVGEVFQTGRDVEMLRDAKAKESE